MRKLYVSPLRGAFDFSRCAIAIVATLLLAACSSKTNDSKMTLSFPDWDQTRSKAMSKKSNLTSMSNDDAGVEIIAINVSGSDFATQTQTWHRPEGSSDVTPTTFSFTVPRGSTPFVQVLAVYGGNNATEFFYGDANVNASDAVAKASVSLSLANTTSNTEGKIVGRFLDQSGTGPTGKFEYLFDPDQAPGGKPEMVVTTGEVFAGWINAFTMNSRLIRYRLIGSNYNFDLSDNATLFNNSGLTRAAQIVIPKSYRDRNGNGSDIEEEPLRYMNLGFFGPGAGSRRLCLNATSSLIPNLYNSETNRIAGNQFQWVGKTSPATGELTRSIWVREPESGFYGKGGDDSGSCNSTGTAFQDFITLDESRLANGDEALGFRGPFRDSIMGRVFDTTTNSLAVHFTPLPGTTQELGGYTIFYRSLSSSSQVNDDDSLRSNDGYSCAKFADKNAFSPAFSSVPAILASGTAGSINGVHGNSIPGISTAATAELTQVVVCPYSKKGEYFESGLMIRGNGGGGTTTATQLRAYAITGTEATSANHAKVIYQMCTPVLIRAVDANGNPTSFSSPMTLHMAASNSGTDQLYLMENCSTNTTGTAISDFRGEQVVYIRAGSTAGSSSNFSISEASGTLSGTSLYFDVEAYSPLTQVMTYGSNSAYRHGCNLIRYVGLAASGAPTDTAGFSLLPRPMTGLSFHEFSDWTCTGTDIAATTFSFYGSGASVASKSMFYKYSGTSSTIDISPTLNSGTPAPTINPLAVSIQVPSAPARLAVHTSQMMTTESCHSVKIGVMDSTGHSVPTDVAKTITVSASNGQFYSDNACSVAAPYSNALAAGDRFLSSPLYFRPAAVGTATVSATDTTGAGSALTTASLSITATLALANRLEITRPQETLNFSPPAAPSFAPLSYPAIAGYYFFLNLTPVTAGGNLASGFSAPFSSLNLTSDGPASFSTLSWVSGVGQIAVMHTAAGTYSIDVGGNALLPNQVMRPLEVLAPTAIAIGSGLEPYGYGSQCNPLLVARVDSLTRQSALISPVVLPFTLNSTNSTTQYFTAQDCAIGSQIGTVGNLNMQFSAGESARLIYMKMNSTSSSDTVSAASSLSSTSTHWPMPTATAPPTLPTSIVVRTLGSATYRTGICQPFMAILTDSSYRNAVPADVTIQAQITASTGSQFYDGPECLTGTGVLRNLTYAMGETTKLFYVKSMVTPVSFATWEDSTSIVNTPTANYSPSHFGP